MLRDAIRSKTPPILWRSAQAVRRRIDPSGPDRGSTRPGLNGLDSLLEPYLDTAGPGYYVELGANDGVNQSNTYFLEKEFGWHGLLIEPSLNRYLELIRNRDPRNAFACAACVPFDYEHEFVRLTYANLMTVSKGLPTDLPNPDDHLRDGRRFLGSDYEVVDFGAIARTLDSLLEAAQAPATIDILSLDVEGAEIPVLSGIDHDRFRFRWMIIESRSIEALTMFLARHGYGLRAKLTVHDYLFTDERQSRTSA